MEFNSIKDFRHNFSYVCNKEVVPKLQAFEKDKLNVQKKSKQKIIGILIDGSDQIESRYILTTSFMERFKNIRKAFGASSIEASLKDNKILIAISTQKICLNLAI